MCAATGALAFKVVSDRYW